MGYIDLDQPFLTDREYEILNAHAPKAPPAAKGVSKKWRIAALGMTAVSAALATLAGMTYLDKVEVSGRASIDEVKIQSLTDKAQSLTDKAAALTGQSSSLTDQVNAKERDLVQMRAELQAVKIEEAKLSQAATQARQQFLQEAASKTKWNAGYQAAYNTAYVKGYARGYQNGAHHKPCDPSQGSGLDILKGSMFGVKGAVVSYRGKTACALQ